MSPCLPYCFMALTVNFACPVLTVLFCCAQPELTFILIDLHKAAQAPEGTGALCAGRWQHPVWLTKTAGSAMSPALIVLQACVAMSTWF